MALTDIGLCARALIKIGANPITSFDDGTVESDIAGALYGPVRDTVLSSYPWSFAVKQAPLNQLQQAPVADYAYAYQLPNDVLRVISIGEASRGRGAHYRIAADSIHTDITNASMTYIFRPEEETFPPFFDDVLITRLAAEFCLPVTEQITRANSLFSHAENTFKAAKQIDGQQESPNRIESFSLIDARA